MKYQILLFFSLLSVFLVAQDEVNIYSERADGEFTIYVDNPTMIPMTVDLKLNMTNMKTNYGAASGLFVVPGDSKRFKIVSAIPINEYSRSGLSLESLIYTGNVKDEHDNNYLYDLPFEPGQAYTVSQGYNGRFSHQGENAIDFSLNVGEKVYAARGGIVYKVTEKHSRSCKKSSCQKFNNFITIYHSDGSFSEYSHLMKDGAAVNVGDEIKQGDFIGYSGNTGWSSGPHLHFVVYQYNKKGERVTLKTKFKTAEKESTYLKEKEVYTKE